MKKATIYDYARLCASFEKCNQCILFNFCAEQCNMFSNDIDKANKIILKWCEEHSVKTRQDKFLEMFPNADISYEGYLEIKPCDIDKNLFDYEKICVPRTCEECKKEYWLAEVDE